MINEIEINGSATTYEDYGVRMGDGFIDALTEPLTLKGFVANESRIEHGRRLVVSNPRVTSRELSLEFVLQASSPEELTMRKNAFLELMYAGKVMLRLGQGLIDMYHVPSDVYHLVYLGKGTTYGMNAARTVCRMMLKFEEPNPMRRTYDPEAAG